MKYFSYRRKSTEEKDRQILSIESQEDEIKKRFPDLEIIPMPAESKSAFHPYERPIFADMLARIKKGEAQGIVCYDPSRLARNSLDAAMVIHFLDTGVLKDLKFSTFHFDNSPEGKMMLNFALSQSKYSSDKLSKDVKRGMQKKCRNGWRPNVAPIGYINDPYGLKGERKILLDPERFDLTRKMWEMLLSGRHNVTDIWKIAREEWHFVPVRGSSFALSTLYKIFTNSFYYGEFEWDGEWFQGQHHPMVTKEEFDKVQLILGRKGKARPQKHRFAFTGMIKCGTCGCFVTAEHKLKVLKKKEETKVYTYYRCTKRSEKIECHEPAVPQEDLEEQITQILDTLAVPENLTRVTIKYLNMFHKREAGTHEQIESSLQKAQSSCTQKIENLLSLYISPENSDKSILSEEEYRARKLNLLQEKGDIGSKLASQEENMKSRHELTEKMFQFATYAKYNFEQGTLEDKKVIFQTLGQNFLLKDRKLTLDLDKLLFVIRKGAERAKHEKEAFSLTVYSLESPKTDFERFWCRGAELNHRRKDFQSFALPLSYPGTQEFCKSQNAAGKPYLKPKINSNQTLGELLFGLFTVNYFPITFWIGWVRVA